MDPFTLKSVTEISKSEASVVKKKEFFSRYPQSVFSNWTHFIFLEQVLADQAQWAVCGRQGAVINLEQSPRLVS
jgi:hypothetical protein